MVNATYKIDHGFELTTAWLQPRIEYRPAFGPAWRHKSNGCDADRRPIRSPVNSADQFARRACTSRRLHRSRVGSLTGNTIASLQFMVAPEHSPRVPWLGAASGSAIRH